MRFVFCCLRHYILVGALISCLNINSLQAQDALSANYQWGRGFSVPSQNFNIGGYVNASYSYNELGGHALALDDLSLFISWSPFSRLHIFSELEVEDLFSLEGVRDFNESFRVERLYADLFFNTNLTLRIGQYLTPFSRWNLVHAAPLVWTTSRPMATQGYVAPKHASGIEIQYNNLLFNRDFNVSVYADSSQHLSLIALDEAFVYAFGTRINYQLDNALNIGTSFVAAKVDMHRQEYWQYTLGTDFLWRKDGYEVQLESFFNIRSQRSDYYGLYLQSVIPVLETLYFVGRYEYMYGNEQPLSLQEDNKHIHVGIAGLTWRPATPIALKFEYRFGHNSQYNAPSGILTSVTLFF